MKKVASVFFFDRYYIQIWYNTKRVLFKKKNSVKKNECHQNRVKIIISY